MYKNLQAVMKNEGVTNREVGNYLGLHENTVGNKIMGKSPISIEEAFKIKERFFPLYELQYLFKNYS